MQIILNELPQTAAEFSAADLTRPEMTCVLQTFTFGPHTVSHSPLCLCMRPDKI